MLATTLNKVLSFEESPISFTPKEVIGYILNCLPPDENYYLPLRRVSVAMKGITDNQTYLNLLNSPTVQQDINLLIKTEADRDSLLQRLKKEITYLQTNKENILQNIRNGCTFGKDKEAEEKKIVESFDKFSVIPQNNSAFSLYQCNKWLNRINEWIIRIHIQLSASGLSCDRKFITRIPSSLLLHPSLASYWTRLEIFSLHGNQITVFPQSLEVLKNINVLSIALYDGKLPQFHSMMQATKLKHIYIVDSKDHWHLLPKDTVLGAQSGKQEAVEELSKTMQQMKI